MDVPDDLEKYRAPALDKGLDILELLAGTDEGLSQAEIAKSLDRSANEIYRMLDRLVRREYVRRTSSERYELTLKLFELAHATSPVRRLVSQSNPVLRRFARAAGQAVHLVVHDRNILVVIAQVDSPGYWNVSVRVGSRIGLVNTGSGHVFLAFASEEDRAFMLEDQNAKTPGKAHSGAAGAARARPSAGLGADGKSAGVGSYQFVRTNLRSAPDRCCCPYLPVRRSARRQGRIGSTLGLGAVDHRRSRNIGALS